MAVYLRRFETIHVRDGQIPHDGVGGLYVQTEYVYNMLVGFRYLKINCVRTKHYIISIPSAILSEIFILIGYGFSSYAKKKYSFYRANHVCPSVFPSVRHTPVLLRNS